MANNGLLEHETGHGSTTPHCSADNLDLGNRVHIREYLECGKLQGDSDLFDSEMNPISVSLQ